MISYTDNPNNPTKKLLELINESLTVQETKPTNKSVAFLYTSNKRSEKERKQSTHNSIKNSKLLRNKFNKGSEGICTLKTVKTLMKETKKHKQMGRSPRLMGLKNS